MQPLLNPYLPFCHPLHNPYLPTACPYSTLTYPSASPYSTLIGSWASPYSTRIPTPQPTLTQPLSQPSPTSYSPLSNFLPTPFRYSPFSPYWYLLHPLSTPYSPSLYLPPLPRPLFTPDSTFILTPTDVFTSSHPNSHLTVQYLPLFPPHIPHKPLNRFLAPLTHPLLSQYFHYSPPDPKILSLVHFYRSSTLIRCVK